MFEHNAIPDHPCDFQVRLFSGCIVNLYFYCQDDRYTFRLELPGEIWIESESTYDSISKAYDAAEVRLNHLPAKQFHKHRPTLHLYLRHRRDSQSYDNKWLDDFKVASIVTYDAVANHCRTALEQGNLVRIHRRKFEQSPATVCCQCEVKAVEAIPGTNGFKVEFHNCESLSIVVPKRLQQGYYFAVPADYEAQDE